MTPALSKGRREQLRPGASPWKHARGGRTSGQVSGLMGGNAPCSSRGRTSGLASAATSSAASNASTATRCTSCICARSRHLPASAHALEAVKGYVNSHRCKPAPLPVSALPLQRPSPYLAGSPILSIREEQVWRQCLCPSGTKHAFMCDTLTSLVCDSSTR